MKSKPSKRELDPMRLANALMPRLQDRTAGKGELLFPAVPSLVPHYHQVIVELFARLSRPPVPRLRRRCAVNWSTGLAGAGSSPPSAA